MMRSREVLPSVPWRIRKRLDFRVEAQGRDRPRVKRLLVNLEMAPVQREMLREVIRERCMTLLAREVVW